MPRPGRRPPRAFPLIVADVSQNALSIFVGAFIYAITALSATSNDYFGRPGRFTLFILTLLTMFVVVLVFVRWVDSIARLGRLGAVIDKVEQATLQSIERRRSAPWLGGVPLLGAPAGRPVHSERIGSLQHVDIAALQRMAVKHKARISLAVLPGALIVPSRPLAHVLPDDAAGELPDAAAIEQAFTIGPLRQFDDDPASASSSWPRSRAAPFRPPSMTRAPRSRCWARCTDCSPASPALAIRPSLNATASRSPAWRSTR